jgi:predicted acyl esterase
VFRLAPRSNDEVQPIEINLRDTAYTFRAGNRLRVHITSSNFPRVTRNRNTDPSIPGDHVEVAKQSVLHDSEYPSALVLPVATS